MQSLNVRDTVRDCLEKDPSDRTEEDIEILLEFTQQLKAFTNMTLAVRRALCAVMVFAVVERAGMVVLNDGEELDSWSVLINGAVEIEHSNGEIEQLHLGDSFGILPTMDRLLHRGVMRTKYEIKKEYKNILTLKIIARLLWLIKAKSFKLTDKRR